LHILSNIETATMKTACTSILFLAMSAQSHFFNDDSRDLQGNVTDSTPTIVPAIVDTAEPTVSPTVAPDPTAAPTAQDTPEPTIAPTIAPTVPPTVTPTIAPTTPAPTVSPTVAPTVAPTAIEVTIEVNGTEVPAPAPTSGSSCFDGLQSFLGLWGVTALFL
jgi:hypothetical protein